MFLSSKSEYYNDFWRSRDIEDWSNNALITEIKLHIYPNRKQLF